MSRYAKKGLVPVHADDEPKDIVWIKTRVGKKTLRIINKRFISARYETGAGLVTEIDPSSYNDALLFGMIDHWEGPGFEGRPFSAAAFDDIDADDPLMEKVLAEIKRLNSRFADSAEDEPDPNSLGSERSDGDASLSEPQTSQRANGTRTSSSRSSTSGPRK